MSSISPSESSCFPLRYSFHHAAHFTQEQSVERRWISDGLYGRSRHAGHHRTALSKNPTRSAGDDYERNGFSGRYHRVRLRRNQRQVKRRESEIESILSSSSQETIKSTKMVIWKWNWHAVCSTSIRPWRITMSNATKFEITSSPSWRRPIKENENSWRSSMWTVRRRRWTISTNSFFRHCCNVSERNRPIFSTSVCVVAAQKTVTGNKVNVQLKRNLLLTLDWNLPDLALSEIFQRDDDMKYSIQAELFDKALLGKKLEPFVDLFLDREFVLHRYLKSDKLVSLFNEAKDREFLTTTSLEGILGLTGVSSSVEGSVGRAIRLGFRTKKKCRRISLNMVSTSSSSV